MGEHWLLKTTLAVSRDHWSGEREHVVWDIYRDFGNGQFCYAVGNSDTGQERLSDTATTADEAAESLCKALGWTEPGATPSPVVVQRPDPWAEDARMEVVDG